LHYPESHRGDGRKDIKELKLIGGRGRKVMEEEEEEEGGGEVEAGETH